LVEAIRFTDSLRRRSRSSFISRLICAICPVRVDPYWLGMGH
jgi:hypothetical protein